ncbi:MAG: hypothetical protein AOA65_0785 [Candidatus Bathyarchaeota archaeon BA1]|nr:MAG: hypothetical protein AOA65_0785 [Candidatus Bathyarchaeota archaeon BA1]
MTRTIEISKREIGYMIWALHGRSGDAVIAEVIGKLLDTLKIDGERVRVIGAKRVEELEVELMKTVEKKAELEEKIKALESEKASLLAEIEALKAIPELEAKVSMLESDIAKLKEEKKKLEEKHASEEFSIET